MNCENVSNQIQEWMKNYVSNIPGKIGFIIGVSGGIDSAVVSTLCARTGLFTIPIILPMKEDESYDRSKKHLNWLKDNFENIHGLRCWLKSGFNGFMYNINQVVNFDFKGEKWDINKYQLAEANAKSRMRMMALYFYAQVYDCIVVGTGNKIEDYGIGFFTKYGDGGVDISPIGDLTKTEVRELAKYLGINQEIIDAKPTDGLWDDNRTDEDQIGCTYEELEWAMQLYDTKNLFGGEEIDTKNLSEDGKRIYNIYKKFHENNAHKMNMPPICKIEKDIKNKE